jgi:hypothetical protein
MRNSEELLKSIAKNQGIEYTGKDTALNHDLIICMTIQRCLELIEGVREDTRGHHDPFDVSYNAGVDQSKREIRDHFGV